MAILDPEVFKGGKGLRIRTEPRRRNIPTEMGPVPSEERITEAGETRLTEAGETRVTE